jgi:hypothetical protein
MHEPHENELVGVVAQDRLEREESEPVEDGACAARDRRERFASRPLRDLVRTRKSPFEFVYAHLPVQGTKAFNDLSVVEVAPGALVEAAGDEKMGRDREAGPVRGCSAVPGPNAVRQTRPS